MCSPMAFAALAAVQTASEISAANQAAEAEQEAAVENQRIQNLQRQMEAEEVQRKAGLELTEVEREAQREQATQRVLAAESGVAGASPLRALGDVYMQEAIKSGSIVALQESDLVRIGTESQADMLRTQSAINVAESKKTTGFAAALQIGGSAATGYYGTGGRYNTSKGFYTV